MIHMDCIPRITQKLDDIVFLLWLLLDSRVVDLPMAYNPTFVILSSSKPLFFNRLKK